MARKLRLKVGDWVMYRSNRAIGRVYDVSLNKPKEYRKYGLYSYKIAWTENTISLDGWTINDITAGNIIPIENPDSVRVLYAKS